MKSKHLLENFRYSFRKKLVTLLLVCTAFLGLGVTTVLGATIPANTVIYFNNASSIGGSTNYNNSGFSRSNTSDVYCSVTSSGNSSLGIGSYAPKNDTWYGKMTSLGGGNYSITITTESTVGKISFWTVNENNYNTVSQTNVVLATLYDGTNNLFTVGAGSASTFDNGCQSYSYTGTWSTYASSNTAPSLTTTAATSVGNATGTMNGNISSNGGASITDYGFYWSTTNNFANGTGTKVQVGTSNYTGNISSVLSSLTNGTTYYYKAYATNSVGTTYGSQQSFTPFIASAPSLTTTTCTYVSSSSFTVNGNISSNGGANITDYGFYYSTDYNFASSTKAQVGTSNTTGAITKTLTGLTDGTTYYYKAYATNSAGTTYGSVESFVLKSGTLSFATSCTYYFDNSQTQWSSVYLVIGHYGYLRSYQASLVSGSGNIYSVTVGSTWSDAKGWYFANGSGGSAITSGTSSYNINTLPASLPTPVTAKTAMSGTAGTCGYLFVPSAATPTLAAPGSWVAYPAKPSLTASAATSVGSSGATLNGNIAHNGGASITDYGFYYSTTNGFADGAGTKAQVGTSNTTGAISKVLSSLNGGTTYYYKAYATNSAGTSYTTQQSFTTTSSIPTLTSPTATSITATGATLGATVTADGGAALTSRGTVWGTGAAPTGNALAEGGTTVAAFSHARTGLTANTTYTYRGYAINSVGTSYSADGTFTTLPAAPTVGSGSGATGNSFTANWSHPSQGEAVSYTYEVQVSTNYSTWADPIDVTGIASSNTSASITGLAAGTTYYYRVLARNATGAGDWSASSAAIATTSTAPSITSSAATSVSSGTGTMNGNVTADGGNTVTARGFYYSTTSGNTNGTGGTAVPAGSGTGAFSSTLNSLTNGTTYYYKAYATNANGTVYSSTEQSFTPCSASVSYAQSVTITACGSKTINLTAGLTGSIPEDAGAVTYTVSPVGDGLTISGSTATFSATANKTYTITISFSNAAYCSVSGTLSVTYTNNTPSISLTNTKTGKSASATYPYEEFVLTATTDNTPVTWTLTQPSGVTDGTLTISPDTKTATFVGGTSNASPYTIEAATVAVGSCSAASVQYNVYVDAPEAENCTAPANCTSTWAYRFDSDANDGSWGSFTDFTCTGTNKWTCKFVLPGGKHDYNFKIFHSDNSGVSYSQIETQFNKKGITSYTGDKTWTIVLTEGGSAGAYTFVILEGDHTSTGGSTPTNPTVLRGAAASVNSGTSEATLYGYLKFTGCSTITDYGFQYANNASFTGATSVTTTGSLTAASTYNKTVSGLSDGTYYYRAYATNGAGTDYSDSATFVIANLKPALTTTAATSIGKTSGTMNGNISSNGGSSITDYGFYYSTTSGFANGAGTKVQKGTSDYTGNISHQLTGLTTGTTYYYKAYATSANGTSYGTQQSFTPAVAVAIKPCAGQTWALNSATTPVALDFGSSTIGTSDYETISVLVVGASGKTLNVNSTSGFKMYNSSDESYDRPVGFAITSDSVCVSVPLRWLPDTDELGTTQDGMTIKGTVSFMVDAITASAETLAVQGTVTPDVLVYPSSAMVMVGQNQTINIAKSCTTTPTATITTGNAAEWTINYTPASGNKNGTFSIAFTGSTLASAVLTITDCESTRTVALSGRAAVTAPTIASLASASSVCNDDFSSFGEIHISNYGGFTSGFTGAYTYQWQKYVSSSWVNYTDGLGANTNNIRPKYSGDYRCIVTRNGVSVTSNTVTISSSSCSATTVCSTLPVMIVNTTYNDFPLKCGSGYWSQCIPNPNNPTPSPEAKAKTYVDVKVLWDGTASDTDGYVTQSDIATLSKLHFDGKAQMSYRGSSSLNFDKKSYSFKVGADSCTTAGRYVKGSQNMFDIAGGKNNDWVLYAAYPDASMMRNKLAIDTYEAMTGLWTSHSRYVELYVDGTYKGVYLFMEKPEEASERIAINPTKGYAFKYDKTDVFDRAEGRHTSDPNKKDGTTFITPRTGRLDRETYGGSVVDQAFEVEYLPNGNEIGGTDSLTAKTDLAALKAHIIAFEDSLAAGNFTKVRQYIDYDSWADWFILNEFTKNVDSYRLSTWFTMDNINAPIKATPVWDYELGFNNNATSVGADHTSTAGWMYSNTTLKDDLFKIPFWFEGGSSFTGTPKGLMDDPCFKAKIKERWAIHIANGGALSHAVITAKINAMDASLSNTASCSGSSPIAREVAKYSVGSRGVAGYNGQSSYATQKSAIETWCTGRRTAMDALIAAFDTNLGASIASSPTGTTQVEDASVSLTTSVTSGTTSSYTYAWYYSATSNGDWTTLSESASTTNVWNIASFGSSNVGYYHCVVTSKACTALVDTATIQLTLNTSCTPIKRIDTRSFNFGTAAATTLPTASNATIASTLSSATLSTWGSQWHIVTDASADHSAFTGWGYGATTSTDQAFLGFRNGNAGIGTSSAFLTYTSTALPATSGSYKVRFYHAPLANSSCSGDKDNSLQVNVSVGGTLVKTETIAVGGTASSTNSWTEWSYTFDTEGWGTAKNLVLTLTNQTAAGGCRVFGLDDFEVLECDNNYQYRLKLYDSNTQTSVYSSAFSTNTSQTLTLPCSGYFTYTAQKKQGSGSWSDIPGKVDVNIPYQSKQVSFDFTGIGATASAVDRSAAMSIAMTALEDSPGSFDWKTVFYTSAGVVTDSIKSADGSKVKTFDSGATYRTFKKYKTSTAFGSFVLADFWCEQSSGSVPAAYTGSNVSAEQEVSVSYTDAASAPTFTLQEVSGNLWVNNALYGTSQSSSNTMARATCSGTQGNNSTGSYYLFKQAAKPSTGGTELAGTVYEGATSKDATPGWELKHDHTNAHVRYIYNTTTDTATVEPMANLSATYDLDTPVTGATAYLLVNKSTTKNATYKMVYGDPNNVEGKGNGVFVLDNVDMSAVTSYKVATLNTYGSSYNDNIWQSSFATPTLTSGYAKFTYDFKTNCLKVDYYNSVDISLNCDNAITVGSNGGVTFKVTNSGSYAIDANTYSLVVKVNGTTRTVTPTTGTGYPAIAIGGTQTFTLDGDNLDVANSNTITVTVSMTGDMNTNNNYCEKCGKPTGETIYYTIDNSLTADDDCSLSYRSLETAITKLKATPEYFNSTTTELKKNIVMNVVNTGTRYVGTEAAGRTGGDVASALTIKLQNINNLDAANYQYKLNGSPRTLTIQAAVANNRPTLQHLIIRKSKNIILDGLVITGSPNTTVLDNAIDIDDDGDWVTGATGRYAAANIRVQNCYIMSTGFTCIHASGYDGLTFVNNDIEAKLTTLLLANSNTQNWGASAKFIRCKNVNFERNNFRGDHATLTWLQESQNVLFMNNVFWSTNNTTAQIAFVRLLSQKGLSVDHNAFYYNTMFLNAGTNTQSYVDFFRLGRADIGEQSGYQEMYDATTIAFEYNNCYSYQPTVTGKRTDTFLGRTPADFTLLRNNNFWSISEGTSSDGLEFGTGARNIHVKQELCSTAPNDPMGLVVKGADLNVGSALTTDITGLGAMSIHRKDRLHTAPIRPESGTGWTIGAYQQTDGIPVDTIIWTGAFDNDWDNRNNWIDAATRQTLSCVHQLSENLVVIIPSYTGSEIYQSPTGQIQHEPILPAQFASDRPIKLDNEHVDAGAGLTSFTPTKFARKIEIEYGGSLLNAHKLKPGEARLYDEVTMHLDLDNRKEWVLVGPVVQPFTDGNKTAVRQLQSGDFFLNFEPHVYMNYVNINTTTGAVTWAAPFTQLTEPVGPQQIFAIRVPDQYGNQKPLRFKLPAQFYYLDRFGGTAEQRALGTAPIKYTFNGRLSDEAGLRQYTIESAHQLLSNTFPANLDAATVAAAGGTVKIWDYDFKSFETAVGGEMIKPMHGFIYSRSNPAQTTLPVTDAMIVFGNTKYRKRTVTQPLFRMNVTNTTNTYGSRINVKYDADKADTFDGMIDSEKLFNDQDLNVPEMYMMAYSKKLSQKGINKQTEIIPLGIRTNVEKSLKFTRYYNDGYEEVILEDRQTGTSYDMLATNAEYIINNVPSGNNEGRFYLHLTVAEDRIPSTIGEETIGSSDAEELDIAIFAQGKQVTVSSSQNLVIETILVSDMAGRTQVFTASNPHFNQLNLQVAQGTYIVKVIGDKGTKEAKVIIK